MILSGSRKKGSVRGCSDLASRAVSLAVSISALRGTPGKKNCVFFFLGLIRGTKAINKKKGVRA